MSDLERLLAKAFSAFVHGDLGPNNVVLADSGDGGHHARAYLVDFEASGFRHFALDAASLRLPFPAYGRWAVLPAEVIAAMDSAYRAEVAAVFDDEDYEAAIAVGCVAWANFRAHDLRLIASTDQEPAQCLLRRTQIVQTLTSAAQIALRAGRFEVLARRFLVLVEAIRKRWTEARQQSRPFRVFAAPES